MKNYTKQLKKKYKKSKKIKYKFNKTKRKSKKNKKGGMDNEKCQEPSSDGWPLGYKNVKKARFKDKPCSYFFWPEKIDGNYYALKNRSMINRLSGDSKCRLDFSNLEKENHRICNNLEYINKKFKDIQIKNEAERGRRAAERRRTTAQEHHDIFSSDLGIEPGIEPSIEVNTVEATPSSTYKYSNDSTKSNTAKSKSSRSGSRVYTNINEQSKEMERQKQEEMFK